MSMFIAPGIWFGMAKRLDWLLDAVLYEVVKG